MDYRTLGDLVKIQKGKKNLVTDSPSEESNRIIQIEDLRNDNNKQYTNDNEGVEIEGDDLLIAWDGANAGLVGFGKKGYLGSTLAVLRKKENIFHTKYVGMFLRSKFDYFQKTSTGATIPHISRFALEKLEIPLPSYDNQIRIAHLLENIESLIAEHKKSIELLEELVKAAFYQLFGDPVINEKGWKLDKLGSLGILDRGVSKHRPRNAPELLGGQYPLIQTGDVSNAGLWLKRYTQTYSELGLKQSKLWPAGTLVITIAANIAKTSILTFQSCFPDSIVGFVSNEEKSNTIFVHHLFSFFQKLLEENAPQSAQKNINLAILRDLIIPVPPLDLQNQFANIAQKIEAIKTEQEAQVLVTEELYEAISQKVFAGGLDLSRIPVDDTLKPKDTSLTQPETEAEQGKDDAKGEGANTNAIIEKGGKKRFRKDKASQPESLRVEPVPPIKKGPEHSSALSWDTVSFEQLAGYISQHFGTHYFNNEMLQRYLQEEQNIFVNYFTSAEQKRNPKYELADDFLSFVSGSLTGQNTFLQLEQVFYNAETENIPGISFTQNDLENLAGKTKKERSGIYFRIKDEVTPG